MSQIHISDLPHQQNADQCLIDIQRDEFNQIKGGLDPDSGGGLILGLGFVAFGASSPILGTGAVLLGVGILVVNALR